MIPIPEKGESSLPAKRAFFSTDPLADPEKRAYIIP